MGFFDFMRTNGGPTLYPSNKTPATHDVLEMGFLYAVLILAFSFLVVLPGVRGKERIFTTIRVVLGVFILGSIMLCNFGQEWEQGHESSKTQYHAGIRHEINATIGVKIGLRSVNITLKGEPVNQVNERIDYNERFYWANPWGQGRAGYGPFAGRVNREYREAQFKGLPYPILWIAEYFTLDGEGIRWGRHYRLAGFYTHIMIWTALPLWILSLILFCMVIKYGAVCMMMTGACLLIGNALYAGIRNPTDLKLPFEDATITLTWGWCFWLNMINGIICVVGGFIVWLLDELGYDRELSSFFGVDVLSTYEDTYPGEDELYPSQVVTETPEPETKEPKGQIRRRGDNGAVNPRAGPSSPGPDDGENYEMVTPGARPAPRVERRDTLDVPVRPQYRRRTKRVLPGRKSRRPAPPVPARQAYDGPGNDDDEDDYVNAPQARNPNEVHLKLPTPRRS